MSSKVHFFFFSSRRLHTRCYRDWSSDVCSSDLPSSASLSQVAGSASSWRTSGVVPLRAQVRSIVAVEPSSRLRNMALALYSPLGEKRRGAELALLDEAAQRDRQPVVERALARAPAADDRCQLLGAVSHANQSPPDWPWR